MTSEQWQAAFVKLLQHFLANEGTTYLYSKQNRDSFVKECGNHPKLREVLDEFHSRPADKLFT